MTKKQKESRIRRLKVMIELTKAAIDTGHADALENQYKRLSDELKSLKSKGRKKVGK